MNQALRFRDRWIFIWNTGKFSLKTLSVFNNSTLKQVFWETRTLFKNVECHFLVESTKIENATFPYKTGLSDTNVKWNGMGSTRWTYHKEWSFAINYFIFSKILFQFKNLVQRVDLKYQPPKCSYSSFSKALEFYLRVIFPCEYP